MHIIDHDAAGRGPPREILASSIISSSKAKAWLQPFESLSVAAALIDGQGRVIAYNNQAAELNGRFFKLQHGRLRLNSMDQRRELNLAHRSSNTHIIALQQRTHFLLIADDGAYCVGSLCELPLSDQVTNHTLLVFREPKEASKSLSHMLTEELGLSHAESRVAIDLHKTCDLSETALSLGLSKETVRSQLKAVFAKLGVSKQSEVVLRVEQLLSLQF